MVMLLMMYLLSSHPVPIPARGLGRAAVVIGTYIVMAGRRGFIHLHEGSEEQQLSGRAKKEIRPSHHLR